MMNLSLSISIKKIEMNFIRIFLSEQYWILLSVLDFCVFFHMFVLHRWLSSMSISSSAAFQWIGMSLLIQWQNEERGFVFGDSVELCWFKMSVT